jgi:hypothetical protein
MIIDPEPYRHYQVTELKRIVRASESGDAPALIAALKAAMARGLGVAFPELSEDLRAVERAARSDAA